VLTVQYIFLNNLALNYATAYATCLALKENAPVWRLLLAGAIGAVFSVFYPIIEGAPFVNFSVRIILSIVMVTLLKKKYQSGKSFLTALGIFYIVSFSFAGATGLLSQWLNIQSALMPFAVIVGVTICLYVFSFIIPRLYKNKEVKCYEYRVEILLECGSTKNLVGYYDSGNKLYNDGDFPVVVIGKHLKESMNLEPKGEIITRTISGIKPLELVNLNFKIHYENGTQKHFNTQAVVSDTLTENRGYDMILHRDMASA